MEIYGAGCAVSFTMLCAWLWGTRSLTSENVVASLIGSIYSWIMVAVIAAALVVGAADDIMEEGEEYE